VHEILAKRHSFIRRTKTTDGSDGELTQLARQTASFKERRMKAMGFNLLVQAAQLLDNIPRGPYDRTKQSMQDRISWISYKMPLIVSSRLSYGIVIESEMFLSFTQYIA